MLVIKSNSFHIPFICYMYHQRHKSNEGNLKTTEPEFLLPGHTGGPGFGASVS